MNYPIIRAETKDGLSLYGLHIRADDSKTVLIHIHGTGSNFYEEPFVEVLAHTLAAEHISLLSTNNRGSGVYDAYERTGAAVEKFEDCLIDIDTWVEFALGEGYSKILLSGHSLGTEKVVYYMNHGKYADKIASVVLLAPADSFGSHRMLDGAVNPRAPHVEELLKQSSDLVAKGAGETFLERNAYGSREGIMPKTADSFIDFLGPDSKLLDALPFATGKLAAYSKINIPILVVIGDGEEYTALPIRDALALMRKENERTEAHQIENCNHDFEGKENELARIVSVFAKS